MFGLARFLWRSLLLQGRRRGMTWMFLISKNKWKKKKKKHACKWKNYVEITCKSVMIRSLFQIPPRSWKIALPVSHCGNYPLSCSFCLFLGADRMLILELAARSSQWKAQVSGICPSQHTVFGELQYKQHLYGHILQRFS